MSADIQYLWLYLFHRATIFEPLKIFHLAKRIIKGIFRHHPRRGSGWAPVNTQDFCPRDCFVRLS